MYSIQLTKQILGQWKAYCKRNGYKMGKRLEVLIREHIKQSNASQDPQSYTPINGNVSCVTVQDPDGTCRAVRI